MLPTLNIYIMRYILAIFCYLPLFTKAQVNLVPNPSFEIATPNGFAWIPGLIGVPPWYNALETTADYWNTAYYLNTVNYQAKTGSGIARIVVGHLGPTPEHMEYPQVKLLQPLVAGKTYHVGYYYAISKLYANMVVMNMGFRFSNDSLLYPSWFITPPPPWPNAYQSYLGENPPYSYTQDTSLFQLPIDTFSYMKLEHYYTAQGGEEFLTIGNLNHIDSSYLMTIIPPLQNAGYLIYYIDDVFVLDLEQLQDTDLVYIDTFNVGVPVTYNCIENSCIDPANATGIYSTLAACQAICNATAIEENNTTKQLLKITDVLVRESKPAPNVPLFYRYDDGTVEKRIVIE